MLSMLHHVRVGALSAFRERLHQWIIREVPGADALPQHLDSPAFLANVEGGTEIVKQGIKLNQVLAHFLLILVPSIVATFLVLLAALGQVPVDENSIPSETNIEHFPLAGGVMAACTACVLLSVYILLKAVQMRQKSYEEQSHLEHLEMVAEEWSS
jgi:H+/gluconate symporter-like permease